MTGREFQSLIRRHLLHRMPGYSVSRNLLFRAPLRYLLCGYCFESSSDPRGFYVSEFVQPLFVPDEGVTLSLGRRLGSKAGMGGTYWQLDDTNEADGMGQVLAHIRRDGTAILRKFETLEDFAKNAITRHTNPYSPYPPEMVAYGAILIGDTNRACKMFNRLEDTLRTAKHHRDYHDEILARARRVRSAFERDPTEAIAILNRWRDETAANLKLTKFLESLPTASSPKGQS